MTKKRFLETAFAYLLMGEKTACRCILETAFYRLKGGQFHFIADALKRGVDDISILRQLECLVSIEDSPLTPTEKAPLPPPAVPASLPSADGEPIDIFIPLSKESKSNNDELRILLRSIAQNVSGLGKVYIATHYLPEWVRGVEVLDIDDTERHNKDANLLNKLIAFLSVSTASQWCFCADDNAFLKPIDLRQIPVIWNGRAIKSFIGGASAWQKRMVRTFRYLDSIGKPVDGNFDSHCPQVFPASILQDLSKVDYRSGNDDDGWGYCIYTLLRGLQGLKRGESQTKWKQTGEVAEDGVLEDKHFIGYSDEGFFGGLRDRLFERFPQKCVFEA